MEKATFITHAGVLYLRFDDELPEIRECVPSSSAVIAENCTFVLSRGLGSYHRTSTSLPSSQRGGGFFLDFIIVMNHPSSKVQLQAGRRDSFPSFVVPRKWSKALVAVHGWL